LLLSIFLKKSLFFFQISNFHGIKIIIIAEQLKSIKNERRSYRIDQNVNLTGIKGKNIAIIIFQTFIIILFQLSKKKKLKMIKITILSSWNLVDIL